MDTAGEVAESTLGKRRLKSKPLRTDVLTAFAVCAWGSVEGTKTVELAVICEGVVSLTWDVDEDDEEGQDEEQ